AAGLREAGDRCYHPDGADVPAITPPPLLVLQMQRGPQRGAPLVDQAAAPPVAPLSAVHGVGAALRFFPRDAQRCASASFEEAGRFADIGAVHPVLGVV